MAHLHRCRLDLQKYSKLQPKILHAFIPPRNNKRNKEPLSYLKAQQYEPVLRYIQAALDNEVSDDLAFGLVATLGRLTSRLVAAPTNSKSDKPYHPTTQSTPDCHIMHQKTPCTAECPPRSHQERSPSKVCLLPRQ